MQGINIENLKVAYGDKVIFDGLSTNFAEGKISVILGGSGVGKSTLLNAIASLLPYEGSVERGDSEVSYIFQKDRLVPTISVKANLELVLRSVVKDKVERAKKIDEMLASLDIESLSSKLPTMISGGEAQRAALARAYLYPADILLADEPFKALDTALKSKLVKQLIHLNREAKRTVIFVTHDISECLLLADEWLVLGDSPAKIIASGSIEKPQEDRQLDDDDLAGVRDTLLKALYSKSAIS